MLTTNYAPLEWLDKIFARLRAAKVKASFNITVDRVSGWRVEVFDSKKPALKTSFRIERYWNSTNRDEWLDKFVEKVIQCHHSLVFPEPKKPSPEEVHAQCMEDAFGSHGQG